MGFAFYKMSGEPPFSKSEHEQQMRDLDELEELCRPVVEYLQKKWHPHARIIVEWDRASLSTEQFGIPFPVPD